MFILSFDLRKYFKFIIKTVFLLKLYPYLLVHLSEYIFSYTIISSGHSSKYFSRHFVRTLFFFGSQSSRRRTRSSPSPGTLLLTSSRRPTRCRDLRPPSRSGTPVRSPIMVRFTTFYCYINKMPCSQRSE